MWRKEDVVKKLKEEQGTQPIREYAQTVGCSASYLNDVYSGRREPGPKMLDHLDLERVETVVYVPKKKWRA